MYVTVELQLYYIYMTFIKHLQVLQYINNYVHGSYSIIN